MIGSPLINYKGSKVAINAIKNLITKGYNCEFRILASAKKEQVNYYFNKEQCSKFTKFYSNIPSGRPVFKWLDDLDIYIQPSFQEGLPRSLIEAMSRACPALGSNTAGIPELLKCDQLHTPGDVKKLTSDLEKLITNKNLLINCAKYNFETSKNYTEEKTKRRRNKFLNTFLADYSIQNND